MAEQAQIERPTFEELANKPVLRDQASAIYEKLALMAEGESGKEDLVRRLGSIYESAGMDSWDISSYLTNSIGDLVAPRTIRKVCANEGWTNQNFNGSGTNAASDSSVSLNSLSEDDKFYQLKLPYYQALSDMRDTITTCMETLAQQYEWETTETGQRVKKPIDWNPLFESVQDREEYYKALTDMFYNIKTTADQCMDGRQSALPVMIFGFVAKIATTTIKHFSSKWFAKIRTDLMDITTKQCTKFVRSEDTISALLGATKHDSWMWAAMDLKCPTCKKAGFNHYVQPKMYGNGTWDFVCDNWETHGKELLHFSHELLTIRINSLDMDRGRAAQFYLQERNIEKMESARK